MPSFSKVLKCDLSPFSTDPFSYSSLIVVCKSLYSGIKHCLALHGLHNIVCMFFYGIWFGYFPGRILHVVQELLSCMLATSSHDCDIIHIYLLILTMCLPTMHEIIINFACLAMDRKGMILLE